MKVSHCGRCHNVSGSLALLSFFLYLAAPAFAAPVISDISIGNVRDTMFTVAWVTSSPVTGTLNYGTTAALGNTAVDVRGTSASGTTHYVTVSGLAPDTSYYFDILSADAVDDNGGSHYRVTTGPVLALPASDTTHGRVFRPGGTVPATGTIVQLVLSDNDSSPTFGTSAPMLALVDTSGYWYGNLGDARTSDLTAYFTYTPSGGDNLQIVAYGGDAGDRSLVINTINGNPAPDLALKRDTAILLSSSPNPSLVGESVVLTATVTSTAGTPTGSVTFSNGSMPIGTVSLLSGIATFTTTFPASGTYTMSAAYSGAEDLQSSTSSPLSQTVNAAHTAVALTSSSNPSVVGQAMTFTATVSVVAPGSGVPTGVVTFRDGTTILGTGTLASGVATFNTPSLTIGSHEITATYEGDTNFVASTSDALSHTVERAATATSLVSAPNPSIFGQAVTLAATVMVLNPGSGTPAGSITFYDGGAALGNGTLSPSGMATLTTTNLSASGSPHLITATYGGDSNYSGSASASTPHSVSPANTIVTLTSSENPIGSGQAVTFTATVEVTAPGGGVPTGTVTFREGTTVLTTVALLAGKAAFTTSALGIGTHRITATYNGSSDHSSSTSVVLSIVVNQGGRLFLPIISK